MKPASVTIHIHSHWQHKNTAAEVIVTHQRPQRD
jgi:hypothetical protein